MSSGTGAWRVRHPTTTRLLLQGVPSVFCGTTLERRATSQNVVSMCAHTSDTHLRFPRAPTLQVIVSVPPERAWRKVCFKSAFCPRKLTFIGTYWKTQDGVSLNYHVY